MLLGCQSGRLGLGLLRVLWGLYGVGGAIGALWGGSGCYSVCLQCYGGCMGWWGGYKGSMGWSWVL